MRIKIITNPDRKITQSVLYFQFHFMGWISEELVDQDDRYGSIPFGYVVGYKDYQIVGVLNLHKRKIQIETQDVLLGGFGGVCTHSNFRRQGIATKLLQSGMEALEDAGCDIAFLCTDLDSLVSLYAQVGFVPLNRTYKATGASGRIYTDEDGMIAPVKSHKIFKQALKMKGVFDLQGQNW